MHNYFIGLLFLFTFCVFSAFAESDPTMPPDWSAATQTTMVIPANIKLTGIISNKNKRAAIINEKTIYKGDFIEGYEVTGINDNHVYLKNNQGIFVIPLVPQVVSPISRNKDLR